MSNPARKGLWGKALELAEQTPESRNRYVDFLRALSILAVVLGHWLIAAPYFGTGKIELRHLLDESAWTHWITWLFQVMPIFFFVGGYSNYSAWESSLRKQQSYASWLAARLKRLLYPVLPLVLGWTAVALIGLLAGLPVSYIQASSRIAIVPTWFLAVYILVVLLVPLTYRAWKALGIWSVIPTILGAALLDYLFFTQNMKTLAWVNYLFVWLTVHQLGYAWRNELLESRMLMLGLFVAGLGSLLAAVTYGPYPLALVGVPQEQISNTLPPKLPLLFLGLAQIGLFMFFQPLAKRLLASVKAWAAVVLVNGMIMTVFLWHSTAMMLVIGAVLFLSPELYNPLPGSSTWWARQPLWIGIYAVVSLPFLLLFSKYERAKPSETHPPLWSLLLGCALVCGGIGYLAAKGIGGASTWEVDAVAIALTVCGAGLSGFGPVNRLLTLSKHPKA